MDTFAFGLFFGIYLITVAFANRWLLFVDEGWKWRTSINWYMVVITNLIFALQTAAVGIAVNGAISEARFVEEGHKPSEYIEPAWTGIVAVNL